MNRRNLFTIAVVAGFVIAGALFGIGARILIGGLGEQRGQLHRCIVTSHQAHPNEDARSTTVHLQAEVPECMAAAGYEKALDNNPCSLAVWQGDVYCYVPKSLAGKLLFKIRILAGGIA